MMAIECIWCREPVELPEGVDTKSYDGEVQCQKCEQFMYVKFVGSKVQKRKRARPLTSEELTSGHYLRLLNNLEEAFRQYLGKLKVGVQARLEHEIVNGKVRQRGIGREEIERVMMEEIGKEVRRYLDGLAE